MMKKVFPLMVVLAAFLSACQLGGGAAAPTAISLPTAFPTTTPIPLNPTAEGSNSKPVAGTERTSSADGMLQAYVPEGTFRMGGLDPLASLDEKPDHSVTLHAFWVDKLEVTNAMYLLCVNAGVCEPPRAFKSDTRPSYFNNPEFNDFPVVYVTWQEANDYCKWAGRRLPTEAEWERAARGDTINTFPWGSERPDGSRANFNAMLGDTVRVGSFPAGASPYGALDMAGNVGEWVSDFYDADYYKNPITNNPTGPLARNNYFNRVVRGGSFMDSEMNIRVSKRASVLGPNPNADLGSPAYYGEAASRIGFRCVSDN
jgi:formylglycine-generating enzyme required for sulfatase activity